MWKKIISQKDGATSIQSPFLQIVSQLGRRPECGNQRGYSDGIYLRIETVNRQEVVLEMKKAYANEQRRCWFLGVKIAHANEQRVKKYYLCLQSSCSDVVIWVDQLCSWHQRNRIKRQFPHPAQKARYTRRKALVRQIVHGSESWETLAGIMWSRVWFDMMQFQICIQIRAIGTQWHAVALAPCRRAQ